MKKYASLLFIFCSLGSIAQQQVITLDLPDSGNKTYVAQQEVNFESNYSFDASTGSMHAYIDQSISVSNNYGNLFNNNSFNSQSINTSLPVGFTPGFHDVAATGGATYIIPIGIPKGTAGMHPNIAISYNSQGENGLVGYGWNIAGLSSITRAGKTIYHNGEVSPITLTNDDRFLLDGNYLVPESGANGPGIEYKTELETFSKITSYGYGPWASSHNSPLWFKVETKDGKTIEYGKTTNSRLNKSGSNWIPVFWRINKITDANGNYITFTYANDNRESRIIAIDYTANDNTGLQAYNRINFYYNLRDDENKSYVSEASINTKYILRKIDIVTEGASFKSYEFEYANEFYSQLTKITEKGSDNTALNSTIFKYGETDNSYTYTDITSMGNSTDDIYSTDYNGDGKSDLILVEKVFDPGHGFELEAGCNFYKSIGNNTFVFDRHSQFDFDQNYYVGQTLIINSMVDYDLPKQIMFGDFKGIGGNGLLYTIPYSTGGELYITDFVITGDQLPYTNNYHDIHSLNTGGFNIIHPDLNYMIAGDFNGDGADDVLTVLGNGSSYQAHITYIRDGITKEVNITDFEDYFVDAKHLKVLDIDGDGKKELLATYSTGSKVYSFDNNTTSNYVSGNVIDLSYPRNSHDQIHVADFNGDGKNDLLTEYQGSWKQSYSYSSGFSIQSFGYIPETGGTIPAYPNSPHPNEKITEKTCRIGDYNGDGKSDILYEYALSVFSHFNTTNPANAPQVTINVPVYIPTYHYDIYYSKGNSEFKTYSHSISNIDEPLYAIGDFNGDGKSDAVFKEEGSTVLRINNFNLNDSHLLLKKVKNGLNNVVEFEYKPLTYTGSLNNHHYLRGYTNTNYPLCDIQPTLFTVSKVITGDGIGGNNTLEYQYRDAVLHKEGKGFLGFNKIIVKNLTTNFSNTATNKINNTFFTIYPEKVTTHLAGNLISEEIYNSSFNNYTNNRYSIQTDNKTFTDHLLGSVTIQDFTYDTDGNMLTAKTNIDGGLEVTEVVYQYESFGNYGIDNKITNKIITKTRNGEPSYTREVSYDYNINNGNLTQKITDPATINEVVTDYVNDNYGNIEKQTISSANLLSKISKFEYDNQGKNLIKTTNPLNQQKHIVYHSKWNKPIKITDIDGNISEMEYDVFGRLTKTISPGNIISETSLHWDIQSGTNTPTQVGDAYFYSLNTQTGSPYQKVWFDQLGRKRLIEKEGFNNQIIHSVQSYDNLGNIKTTTTPFYSGDIPVISTTTYDAYNRVSNTSSSIGNSVSYNYNLGNGETTTTTVNDITGQSSNSVADASGKTIHFTDDGGTISYEYHSNGKQREIKLANTVLASMVYNNFGRQTELNDANAGVTTYEYNAYGDLISQIDANGNEFTMEYDVVGRTEKETNFSENEIVTYDYFSSGSGINFLEEISSNTGSKRMFEYDNYNRLIKETEIIDGLSYATNYGYDNLHNLTHITYPSGFEIEHVYDNKSFLTTVIAEGNTPIFTAMEQNALGQYTKYNLGNGITTEKSYSSLGMPETFYAQGVQDLTFDFESSTGNLLSRTDGINNQTEDFTYDDLNRLTSSSINGTTYAFDYNPNGNIEFKTGIGDYQYASNRPNAIRRIYNPTPEVLNLPLQEIEYNAFHNTKNVTEGDYELDFTYSPGRMRNKMTLNNIVSGATESVKYYTSNYEKEVLANGDEREMHYIAGGDGIAAMYVIDENGNTDYYFAYTDYLGSILTLTDNNGNIVVEQSFDTWGKHRNPSDWTDYTNFTIPSEDVGSGFEWLDRGFTGHEHLPKFTLINMNGRTYDPLLARMLSPDNYVQSGFGTQGFNRYSYAANNPLKYTDPDGEIIFTALAIIAAPFTAGTSLTLLPYTIGADIGSWQGGTIANGGETNPLKWDYSSGKTWSYMAGGAAVGAASGGLANTVATSGIAFANTASIIAGSLANSVGMSIVTGGQTDLSVSFGFGSYNFSSGDFGYLGKKGNSTLENIGYGLGAYANAVDIYDYAVWDRFSAIEKVEKINKEFDANFKYDPNETGYYGKTMPNNDMYLGDLALENRPIARLTAEHELVHFRQNLANGPATRSTVIGREIQAYVYEESLFSKYNVSSRYIKESRAMLRYYLKKANYPTTTVPNSVSLKALWLNIFR